MDNLYKVFDLKICIILFFVFMFFIHHIYYKYIPQYKHIQEGFMNKENNFYEGFKESMDKNNVDIIDKKMKDKNFIYVTGKDIWSKFYCSIYDSLFYDPVKNNYEINELIKTTDITKKSNILIINSNTGHHVKRLHGKGFKVTGLDNSMEMIERCKKKHNGLNFIHGDVTHSYQFNKLSLSHVLMFDKKIYYVQDKKSLFHNIYTWLKPGGYMVIHLMDRDFFNTRVKANDVFVIDPQEYSNKRITKSYVKFDNFQYKSDFSLNKDKNIGYFIETIKEDEGPMAIRNEHKYYMEPKTDIILKAKKLGFKLKGKINLGICRHENEYLYVFYKPKK